jgi:hypothetical protein
MNIINDLYNPSYYPDEICLYADIKLTRLSFANDLFKSYIKVITPVISQHFTLHITCSFNLDFFKIKRGSIAPCQGAMIELSRLMAQRICLELSDHHDLIFHVAPSRYISHVEIVDKPGQLYEFAFNDNHCLVKTFLN